MQLSVFQDAFVTALQDAPDTTRPDWISALLGQPGFAVYRNSGRKAAIDALRANFPSIEALVGEAWFHGAAQTYLSAYPPRDGRLMDYGDAFPAFLQGFPPAAELPYLHAVAALDRAWTESHLAADAPVLAPDWMATLTADTFTAAQLAPHPAAQWRWCDDHPAFTIWQRQRNPGQEHSDDPIAWRAEGALLTRPEGAVQWCALPAAGAAFLDACAAGASLADAAARAMTAEESHGETHGDHTPVDLSALIALLLTAGALRSPNLPTQTETA